MTDKYITLKVSEIEELRSKVGNTRIAMGSISGNLVFINEVMERFDIASQALIDKAQVCEPVATIVYDRKVDAKGNIYQKSYPQIWSMVSDNELLSYAYETKLYTTQQPDKVAELEAKVAELERGEFICAKCYLRKDAESSGHDF